MQILALQNLNVRFIQLNKYYRRKLVKIMFTR